MNGFYREKRHKLRGYPVFGFDYEEEKHKRDEGGKWATKEGGGGDKQGSEKKDSADTDGGSVEDRFEKAVKAYKPEPGASPSTNSFVSAWRGIEAVLGKDAVREYNDEIHQALGQAAGRSDYGSVRSALVEKADSMEEPGKEISFLKRPEMPGREPTPPTEEDAKMEFDQEFKRVFPTELLNSKKANELRKTHMGKAKARVEKRYQEDVERHKEKQDEYEMKTKELQKEIKDKTDRVNDFKKMVSSLPRADG